MTCLESRFWGKVNKHTPNGCWEWGGSKTDGYGDIKVNGKTVKAHRVAYELSVGPIPDGKHLDHVCHNRACVNPAHIRVATNTQNSRNRLLGSSNTSGLKGVSWHVESRKWVSRIGVNGRVLYLGLFNTPESAHEAYCKAAREYFGEFANEGFAAGVALGYVGGKR